MTIGFKTIISLVVAILILFLAVYSVLKYSNEEDQKEYSGFFYSAQKGENMAFSFLYSVADFNWFKSDVKLIKDSPEEVYSKVEEIEMPQENIRNIDIYQLLKKSLNFNNWHILWNNYWQEQSGWFDKELEGVAN